MNKEIIYKFSTWHEFEKYIVEFGLQGRIPYIFEIIHDDDMLTPFDVSELTGYSEETIRRWCRSWKLRTTTGRPPYNIKGSDLKEFLFYSIRKDLIKSL